MPDFTPGPEQERLDAVFVALSDARRREMISRLSKAALSATDLAAPLGMAMPSAVKHLAVLEAGGLVDSEKVGRVRTYRLRPGTLDRVRRWIDERERDLTASFDRLADALAEFPETPEE